MQRGMSLVEVLLVLAVIGMLATLAYPIYTEQVRQAARHEAVALLLDTAQRLERHRALAGRYADTDAVRTPLPPDGRHYRLVAMREASRYQVQAVRLPGGLMAQDACGDYRLDQAGVRSNPGANGEGERCW